MWASSELAYAFLAFFRASMALRFRAVGRSFHLSIDLRWLCSKVLSMLDGSGAAVAVLERKLGAVVLQHLLSVVTVISVSLKCLKAKLSEHLLAFLAWSGGSNRPDSEVDQGNLEEVSTTSKRRPSEEFQRASLQMLRRCLTRSARCSRVTFGGGGVWLTFSVELGGRAWAMLVVQAWWVRVETWRCVADERHGKKSSDAMKKSISRLAAALMAVVVKRCELFLGMCLNWREQLALSVVATSEGREFRFCWHG